MKIHKHSLSLRWVSVSAIAVMALVLAACAPSATPTPTALVPVTGSTATSAPTTSVGAPATLVPTTATAPTTAPTPMPTSAPTTAATAAPISASTATPMPTPTGPATVATMSNSTLGTFLVDGNNMTLYMFKKDTPGVDTCTGACLSIWSPLLTNGAPTAGTGIDSAKLGTITLADGASQVTYNDMPLYTYSGDTSAGDTNGQAFKNLWYVVAPSGVVITVNGPATLDVTTNATLGSFLVDGNGMTLYMFKNDTPGVDKCSGGCLLLWTPLLTNGAPVAGTGADSSMIGTITLSDGSSQVTYNKMPLYLFSGDMKTGDVTGQDFKNLWYVVSPSGSVITTALSSSTSTTPTGPTTVNVSANATLGNILVTYNGYTLYQYKNDTPGVSNCTGGCASIWPPYLTQNAPTAGTGVNASKLGTIKLPNGDLQVTYNNLPLYTYSGDASGGETNGQGIANLWSVVTP